jgi:hypothetical protein
MVREQDNVTLIDGERQQIFEFRSSIAALSSLARCNRRQRTSSFGAVRGATHARKESASWRYQQARHVDDHLQIQAQIIANRRNPIAQTMDVPIQVDETSYGRDTPAGCARLRSANAMRMGKAIVIDAG